MGTLEQPIKPLSVTPASDFIVLVWGLAILLPVQHTDKVQCNLQGRQQTMAHDWSSWHSYGKLKFPAPCFDLDQPCLWWVFGMYVVNWRSGRSWAQSLSLPLTAVLLAFARCSDQDGMGQCRGVNPLLATPAFHILHFCSSSLPRCQESSSGRLPKCLGPCYPGGRPTWSSKILYAF